MEKGQDLKTRNYDYEKQQSVETIDIIYFISLKYNNYWIHTENKCLILFRWVDADKFSLP